MPSVFRSRRSLLFMPGSNPRALEKARTLPADGLIFDLEDAVLAGPSGGTVLDDAVARWEVCRCVHGMILDKIG